MPRRNKNQRQSDQVHNFRTNVADSLRRVNLLTHMSTSANNVGRPRLNNLIRDYYNLVLLNTLVNVVNDNKVKLDVQKVDVLKLNVEEINKVKLNIKQILLFYAKVLDNLQKDVRVRSILMLSNGPNPYARATRHHCRGRSSRQYSAQGGQAKATISTRQPLKKVVRSILLMQFMNRLITHRGTTLLCARAARRYGHRAKGRPPHRGPVRHVYAFSCDGRP